jgi:hypothetical protein
MLDDELLVTQDGHGAHSHFGSHATAWLNSLDYAG